MMKISGFLAFIVMLAAGILTLTACREAASPLEDVNWVMTSYSEGGEPVNALPGTDVTVLFDSRDKTVKGSGGCNAYSGNYTLDGMNLSFTELFMTLMACQDAAVMAQEHTYIDIFKDADSFEVKQGKLIIYSGQKTITFKRVDTGTKTISQRGE